MVQKDMTTYTLTKQGLADMEQVPLALKDSLGNACSTILDTTEHIFHYRDTCHW